MENNKNTVRLNITMAYTFVGDTGIDIPAELLEGKAEEEKLKIAYDYAREHIAEIPVADNAEYVADSDDFELEDCDLEDSDRDVCFITKDMIISGIKAKLVTFELDPNRVCPGIGTVCKIGDDWFYFGGVTAEESSPMDYAKNVPMEEIVDEIFSTLESYRINGRIDGDEDLKDAYFYYWKILTYRNDM